MVATQKLPTFYAQIKRQNLSSEKGFAALLHVWGYHLCPSPCWHKQQKQPPKKKNLQEKQIQSLITSKKNYHLLRKTITSSQVKVLHLLRSFAVISPAGPLSLARLGNEPNKGTNVCQFNVMLTMPIFGETYCFPLADKLSLNKFGGFFPNGRSFKIKSQQVFVTIPIK